MGKFLQPRILCKWDAPNSSRNPPCAPRPLPGAKNMIVVEWDGSSFSPLSVASRFGCQVFQLEPRWNDDCSLNDFVPGGRVDVLIGTVRTAQECKVFSELVRDFQPGSE